jgi:hypothetical protein
MCAYACNYGSNSSCTGCGSSCKGATSSVTVAI